MRASFFPSHNTGLRSSAGALHCPKITKGTHPFFSAIVCSTPPPRDVVIDFGKYKGCKLGTLPSRYLQWLIRESHHPSLSAWGDCARQVLQDPHYRDRLEWQRLENLVARGGLRKDGPPASSAGARSSMAALGWDLSDSKAWFKVNVSQLGTTEGGRIPRKAPESTAGKPRKEPSSTTIESRMEPSPSTIKPRKEPSSTTIKPAAPQPMSVMAKATTGAGIIKSTASRLSRCEVDGSLSSGKAAIEARVSSVPVGRFSDSKFDGSSSVKATNINSVEEFKASRVNSTGGQAEQPRVQTLQEEVLRRRQLRRERSAPKSSIMLSLAADKAKNLFPGRESLLKRARKRKETAL